MITYGDLLAGYRKGVVKFIVEPGQDHGIVCDIGHNWFYFSDTAMSYVTPDEMLACESAKTVIEWVYSALNSTGTLAGMDEYDPEEYSYYETVLREAGCSGHIA